MDFHPPPRTNKSDTQTPQLFVINKSLAFLVWPSGDPDRCHHYYTTTHSELEDQEPHHHRCENLEGTQLKSHWGGVWFCGHKFHLSLRGCCYCCYC